MQPNLYLQQHVYACGIPDVILLDLRKNRYLAIPERQSRLLAALVPGWPHAPSEGDDQIDPTSAFAIKAIDDLIAREILTTTPSRGKNAMPATIAKPARSLIPAPQLIPTPSASTTQRARRLPALVRAALTAAFQLKFRRIETVVAAVAARRSRAHRDAPLDTASLMEDFYWLRPFVFSGSQQCLFHSLTLLHFLAAFNVYPHWVFGVRKAPFGAHCWVQEDSTICNDTADRVAMFTPIMIV